MPTAHDLTKELAENHDIAFIDRGNGHLQLKTKNHLVNYWPYSHSRTVWSDTAKYKEVGVTPERAIAICFELEAQHFADREQAQRDEDARYGIE